jgi:tellurite resistance protein TerA
MHRSKRIDHSSDSTKLERIQDIFYMQLSIGANTAIPSDQLELHLQVVPRHATHVTVDVSAYALAESSQKVRGDQDMIFYGQLRHISGAIELQQIDAQQNRFMLNLPQVDASLGKIAFTATLEQAGQTFNSIERIELKLLHRGQIVAQAQIDGQGRSESALILAECYRRQGAWKFRLIGQGFNGGLQPLAEHFGVEISNTPPAKTAVSAPVSTTKPIAATVAPTAPPAPKVSLSKVSLTKNNRQVSLEKTGAGFGEIRINLNWNKAGAANNSAKMGFFSKLLPAAKGVDLDLGCLYELQDGQRAIVQALGNMFGDFNRAPYIKLSGDDRTGSVSDGEWMRINGQQWSQIKRVIIYAFIYEGAPNWAATDAVVTIYVPNQPPIEIALSEGDASKSLCGVVLLENRGGSIHVSREVNYFSSQKPLDEHYGWGLRWKAGSKD